MNNIVYFAGVHGSGKSTLIKRLAEDDRLFSSYEKLEIPKADGVVERNNIRLCRSYLQQFYQQQAAAAAPDKVLLCDRSWLDTAAYTRGFSSLGWFTPEQSEKERALETLLFNNRLPGKLVWVNPPYDWCHANLAKRWNKGEKKWREEDERYHSRVHAAYAQLLTHELPNASDALLELSTTDLDGRVEQVRAWLRLPSTIVPMALHAAG